MDILYTIWAQAPNIDYIICHLSHETRALRHLPSQWNMAEQCGTPKKDKGGHRQMFFARENLFG